MSETPRENIEKDLQRTFPNEKFFIAKDGRTKLASLLCQIAGLYPEVGYLQGMNQVLAFVLMVNGGDESQALSFYQALEQRDHINGFFVDGFPLNFFYQFVFLEELKKRDKKVYLFVKDLPSVCWTFKWFNTLFLYSFPLEFCVQVWDRVVAVGLFFIVFVAVSMLLNMRDKILAMKDHDELLDYQNHCREGENDLYAQHKDYLERTLLMAQEMSVSKKQI